LYVRLVIVLVIILFIGLFIFLIIKIDVVGHLFNNKNYIRTASSSNLDRYISELDDREFAEKKREKKKVEEKKKDKEEEVVDKSIFKFIEAIKNKRDIPLNDGARKTRPYDGDYTDRSYDGVHTTNPYKNVGASYASPNEKQKEIEKEKKKIQSFYDKGYYPKSSWMLVDTDLDGYGFNYYFNDKGKMLVDTVAPDYRIVDVYGREIDEYLEPISYKVEVSSDSEIKSNISTKYGLTSDGIILSPGVTLKEKSKHYDNQKNRHVLDYIDSSLRFKKTTNGTIYDGSKWKSVSSLRADGGYVIFNNPNNNFNKVIGKITIQKLSNKDDENTFCTLYVYDADLYDLYRGYEDLLEPLYETSAFNYNEPFDFNFTFYRTVKRLRFQIETVGDNKLRTCYLKDLRYGFNNVRYKEELEEAKEKEEYIAYMKTLGIYQNDEEMLAELKSLEEDSTSDYLEYEDFNDIDMYDGIDLSDYDRNLDKEQRAIDRRTGPVFDEYLRSLKNYWEIEYGPGYE
jgi:hypothetical protein